jgi:hypothetical protein
MQERFSSGKGVTIETAVAHCGSAASKCLFQGGKKKRFLPNPLAAGMMEEMQTK